MREAPVHNPADPAPDPNPIDINTTRNNVPTPEELEAHNEAWYAEADKQAKADEKAKDGQTLPKPAFQLEDEKIAARNEAATKAQAAAEAKTERVAMRDATRAEKEANRDVRAEERQATRELAEKERAERIAAGKEDRASRKADRKAGGSGPGGIMTTDDLDPHAPSSEADLEEKADAENVDETITESGSSSKSDSKPASKTSSTAKKPESGSKSAKKA